MDEEGAALVAPVGQVDVGHVPGEHGGGAVRVLRVGQVLDLDVDAELDFGQDVASVFVSKLNSTWSHLEGTPAAGVFWEAAKE